MINRFVYFLWQKVCALPFPVYRVVVGLLCCILAVFVLLFGHERRKVLWTNLTLCFPKASVLTRLSWAAKHVYLYLRTFIDRGWLWFGSSDNIHRRVFITNPEKLKVLKGNSKRTILLTPHFLGLDAAWSRLSIELNMVTMYSKQKDAELDQLILNGRTRFGDQKVISRQQGAALLVKEMKTGRPLYYLPDMDFGAENSVFVEFFGVQAATLTTVGRLSRLLGAEVFPVTTLFKSGYYFVTIHDQLPGFPAENDACCAKKVNQFIEVQVQENVPQYLWTHKRFKTRPPGEKKYY